MLIPKLHCGFATGTEEDLDQLDLLQAEIMRALRRNLAIAGADIDEISDDGIERFHIPFCYDGVSSGIAVLLVGMVPSRWLISVTGKAINDSPDGLDVSWLPPAIESAVIDACGAPIRWYDKLEDVPMA